MTKTCCYCEKGFPKRDAATTAADEPGERLIECPHCGKWAWDSMPGGLMPLANPEKDRR